MFQIRATTTDDIEQAFGVLRAAGAWLQSRGRRQRITHTTESDYRRWQADGGNYVVTDNEQVVGVLTIRHEVLADWPSVNAGRPVYFLRGLATHPDHRGRGVGAAAVQWAVDKVGPEPLYLDCVSDFLPEYYAAIGFEPVERQIRAYPEGTYDITLMRSRCQ